MTHNEMNQILSDNYIQFTRKDYMSGAVDHQTYYQQFVTDSVYSILRSAIGQKRIEQSTDEHFNDIPLRKFDAIASFVPSRLVAISNVAMQADGTQPSISLSDRICILKAAAHVMRERARIAA